MALFPLAKGHFRLIADNPIHGRHKGDPQPNGLASGESLASRRTSVSIAAHARRGHATDSERSSLRQERKAKRICRSESVFLATDRSIFCTSAMACSSMRTRSPCLVRESRVFLHG